LNICSPDCPDWTRRIQASSCEANSPNSFGIVRVEACPSWWQPMQPTFFTCLSQSVWVISSGMSPPPPNWPAPGIFSIEYQ
jgi:hypothetical protein